jgi:hypothetical protein
MRPFPDCAIAMFVLCCSERVAPVVLTRQQNAILRRECCKRHCSHRQERTCRETWIVPSPEKPAVFLAQANFVRPFVDARADVPW